MSVSHTVNEHEIRQRRAAARRTAFVLALIAASIFAVFLLSGILGRA